MTVDISKIKPGDRVSLVPLEVWSTDDESGLIYVKDSLDGATFNSDQIATHHPRQFQVGDRVRAKYWPDTGTVAGVYTHEVWVKWDGDSDHHPIWPADRLVVLET